MELPLAIAGFAWTHLGTSAALLLALAGVAAHDAARRRMRGRVPPPR